jgi:Zn-dependent oligopeptidase
MGERMHVCGWLCSGRLLHCCCCREVETLFHEFGHALQHMLTTVDEGLVAGIRWVGVK